MRLKLDVRDGLANKRAAALHLRSEAAISGGAGIVGFVSTSIGKASVEL